MTVECSPSHGDCEGCGDSPISSEKADGDMGMWIGTEPFCRPFLVRKEDRGMVERGFDQIPKGEWVG